MIAMQNDVLSNQKQFAKERIYKLHLRLRNVIVAVSKQGK